jgi:peptidoglycan/xylan/chitin deacetylase (PgdA/CDA1 family)
MLNKIKFFVLKAIKYSGGFRIVSSSRWRQNRLLILCYHGFSLRDEHTWRPGLYMTSDLFESRLQLLKKKGFNVLPLDMAVERLANNDLPPRSIAITIDDGFYDFFAIAFPLLQKYVMPATVYVSSWHVLNHQHPVFNLMVSYLFWRGMQNCGLEKIRLSENGPSMKPADILKMESNENLSLQDKDDILRRIASEAHEDFNSLLSDRVLSFMKPDEIKSIDSQGIDIQLHTHRHRVPRDKNLFMREIEDNREALTQCGIKQENLIHFCYPSGVHHPEFLPWLEEARITTATTCVPGLAKPDTHSFLLPRFIDTSATPKIEIEAWAAGIREIFRRRVRQFT